MKGSKPAAARYTHRLQRRPTPPSRWAILCRRSSWSSLQQADSASHTTGRNISQSPVHPRMRTWCARATCAVPSPKARFDLVPSASPDQPPQRVWESTDRCLGRTHLAGRGLRCDIAIATARGVIDAQVRGGVSIVMAPTKAQCSTMDGSLCADSNRRRARQRTTDESIRSESLQKDPSRCRPSPPLTLLRRLARS